MKRTKKLEELATRARELSEKKDLTPEESAELETVMTDAKSVQGRIHQDRQIDEFVQTISDAGEPQRTEPKSDVYLARDENPRFGVYAERKGFEAAAKAWKAGDGAKSNWGFDIRYKTDLDDSVSETGAGSRSLVGAAPGEQLGGAVPPYYYPGIIEPPTREPRVADLFAQGSTDSNVVRLVKETVTVNGAGPEDEGVAYGKSKIQVSPQDFPVKDIVTLLPVTEDILMDIPAMSAYLGMRLSKFVRLAEEEELLQGDGTGAHLTGITHLEDRTVSAQGVDDIDTAVLKLNAKVYRRSFIDPTWVLMSPTTWATYVTLRTNLNGGMGQFLAGPPSLSAARNIWGLPIVVTPVVPDDRVFVGNPMAAMVFRNGGLRIESSTGYGTFFGEGLVAIRGKVRTAFAVFRPQAIGELVLGS